MWESRYILGSRNLLAASHSFGNDTLIWLVLQVPVDFYKHLHLPADFVKFYECLKITVKKCTIEMYCILYCVELHQDPDL